MFQTTSDDVVLSGHGATLPQNARTTKVPNGVEFITFGPPGSSITDQLGQMLEGGIYISNLFVTSPETNERSPLTPSAFTAASGDIPNLLLSGPRDIEIAGMGAVPHIIGVEADTHLGNLWQRVKPFIKPNRTVRVIWAACSSLGVDDPSVDGE
ncbi:MAG: putative adhesin [Candidatus Puniceispirillaceae bacterium]